jgi:hypothetical protein
MSNAIDILSFKLYEMRNHILRMKMLSDEVQCDLVKDWPEQAKEIEVAIELLKSAEVGRYRQPTTAAQHVKAHVGRVRHAR